ncbi:MAG: DUF1684 domain-containing protein [Bacteroidetes bacterium]|nr:DUF1684 domain-containing protein [Bacteroidota bacterium]
MKKITKLSVFITLCALLYSNNNFAQDDYVKQIEKLRSKKDVFFKSDKGSPLPKDRKNNFEHLAYFAVTAEYKIKGEYKKLRNQPPFAMTGSTGKTSLYIKHGVISFKVNGVDCKLFAYQDPKLAQKAKWENYLFVPFRDLTNGEETFGGGRYIQWSIQDAEKGEIDFNNAFNPSCVYNIKKLCPIPPDENTLDVKIEAGEKDFDMGAGT